MTTVTELEHVAPGLLATTAEPLAFAPDTAVRSFLLQRAAGNVLVYVSASVAADARAIAAARGAERQYVTHEHEAMFLPANAAAPLFAHEHAAAAVEGSGAHLRGTWSRRHQLDDDLELIPIPGHTPSATALLWSHDGRRALFTGDSLYPRADGSWGAAVLDSSDRAAYLDSLALLRELEFDLLVPWAAPVGGPAVFATDPDDARGRLDAVIARLRAGASS